VALVRLETMGLLRLPKRLLDRGGRPPLATLGAVHVPLKLSRMPASLKLQLVASAHESRLWNSLIAEYHYLGLATPVGRLIRYVIYGDDQLLGAISYTDCAWSLAGRDQLLAKVGLPVESLRDFLIANNRFLILPSVQVPNLASRILSTSTRQVCMDWASRFNRVPLVVETFVDPSRFEGTCYRAANWLSVGLTKGYCKSGGRHSNRHSPKLLFMRGLTAVVHRRLELAIATDIRHAA